MLELAWPVVALSAIGAAVYLIRLILRTQLTDRNALATELRGLAARLSAAESDAKAIASLHDRTVRLENIVQPGRRA